MRKLLFIAGIICSLSSFSQSNLVSAGGDGFGNGGEFNYSIGQIDYMTYEGVGGSVSLGNQQAIEIFTNNLDENNIKLRAFVYPNPAHNFIIIHTEIDPQQISGYNLFSSTGELVLEEEINEIETKVPLGALPNASYFLKLNMVDGSTETFKILKNQ